MSFPLLVRSARVGFQGVDQRLEQIARTLGARDMRVFFTITLPLASRGIVAGIVLAFARAVGEFGATILVAEIFREEQQRFRSKFSPPYNLATTQLPIVFWSYASSSLSPRYG